MTDSDPTQEADTTKEPQTADKPDPLVASDFGLTDQQADAMALDRHLAVTAAAGTGKTTALAARYLHILQQTDSTPSEIVTITFTRKATTEMRDRIRENVSAQLAAVEDEEFDRWRSISDDLTEGYIHTIDAFCARLLREYAVEAGVDPDFEMLDEVDAPVLQREAITNYLDRNSDSRDLELVARLWNRDTVIELLRGLLEERPESTEWAQNQVTQSTEAYTTELIDVFSEVEPADARELLNKSEMQSALATLRSLDLEELGVPDGDYAWNNIQYYLRPAAKTSAATTPEEASDQEVLRTLRWLYDGISKGDGTPYNSARGRGSHYIAGKKSNWPDAAQESYRDALEVLLEEFDPRQEEIRTIPSWVDENAAPYVGAVARVYLDCLETYENLKDERTAFDFDDLLTRALDLIESDETIRKTLQDRFGHIMVDEFQDTDTRQWRLVSLLSGISDPDRPTESEATVFVVGDKKQSIYRFRGADVATFSDARSDLVEANCKREGIVAVDSGSEPPTELELTGSFRTLPEPIDVLNPLFETVFQPAGAEYEPYEAEPQSIGTKRSGGTDIDGSVEYLIVPEDDTAASALYDPTHPLQSRTYLDTGDREAHALAARISTHLEAGTEIFDEDSDEYRGVEPRDIAVLLRTRKNLDAYERAFDEYGIPVNVISGDGYWGSPEIRMLCNLIEVLFDPTQDIPLYGLLRSPMFGFTDSELALLAEDGNLWTSMSTASDASVKDAYQRISDWRAEYGVSDAHSSTVESTGENADQSSYVTVNKLLTTVCEETGIMASVAAGERGQQAVANIRKFREQVRNWSDQGVRTLASIRDRISSQQAESAKERDASLPTETGGVRILTVHASKGLEYPIVAVPEIGRQFNFDGSLDERRQAYLGTHPSETSANHYLGTAAPGIEDSYSSSNTTVKEVLHSRNKDELRAEEKRTLYVACTRVRDHLLLSGTHEVETDYSGGNPELQLSEPADHAEASRWRDWVQPALVGTDANVLTRLQENESVPSPIAGAGEYIVRTAPEPIEYDSSSESDYDLVRRSLELPTGESDFARPSRLTATTLVTSLDEELIDSKGFDSPDWYVEGSDSLLVPPTSNDVVRGATLGTIVHRVCEFGPFDSTDQPKAITDRVITGEGLDINEDEVEYIQEHVERGLKVQESFLQQWSDGSVRRELPVRLGIDGTTIVGEIDLLVITDEAYHILDYKTNRITDLESDIPSLCQHYRPQLEVYAAALQRDDPTRSVTATLHFTASNTAQQLTFDLDSPPMDSLEQYVTALSASEDWE